MCGVMLHPPGSVVGHLGVNHAPQSGSGSGSINHLCSDDCHLPNADVRLVALQHNIVYFIIGVTVFGRACV